MLTVPSHYCRVVAQSLDKHGKDSSKVLAELGISEEIVRGDEGLVHVDQYVRLVQEAWTLLDDEYWGFSTTPCKPGLFALMVRYTQQFDTVEVLLKELCRFYNTTRNDIFFELKITDKHVTLAMNPVEPEQDSDHFLMEFMLIVMHRFTCWISGKRIILQKMQFSYKEPSHSSYYSILFPCDLFFEQSENSFTFDKKFLSLPLIRSHSEIKEYLKNSPADFMSMPGSDDSFSTQIKGILIDHQRNSNGFPDFNSIASDLNVSPQTLRRKLQAENNSYQQIKDIIRRDIAIEKLVYENMPVSDIGYQLGFVEPASFTRAFKQWVGVSPAEYRLTARQ